MKLTALLIILTVLPSCGKKQNPPAPVNLSALLGHWTGFVEFSEEQVFDNVELSFYPNNSFLLNLPKEQYSRGRFREYTQNKKLMLNVTYHELEDENINQDLALTDGNYSYDYKLTGEELSLNTDKVVYILSKKSDAESNPRQGFDGSWTCTDKGGASWKINILDTKAGLVVGYESDEKIITMSGIVSYEMQKSKAYQATIHIGDSIPRSIIHTLSLDYNLETHGEGVMMVTGKNIKGQDIQGIDGFSCTRSS